LDAAAWRRFGRSSVNKLVVKLALIAIVKFSAHQSAARPAHSKELKATPSRPVCNDLLVTIVADKTNAVAVSGLK
jgi:hypothetical protein